MVSITSGIVHFYFPLFVHLNSIIYSGILQGMETAYFEPAQLTNCYQVIRLTHPHYLVLRRLSYLLCQTLLISVYPLAGVKMKKCISVIYTDIHSIYGIRQKMLGYAREIAYFSKTVAKERNTAQRFLCLLCRNCDVSVMDR